MVGTAPVGAQPLSSPMGTHPGLTQGILAIPQALFKCSWTQQGLLTPCGTLVMPVLLQPLASTPCLH